MTFEEILPALRAGKKARRKDWLDSMSKMYIAIAKLENSFPEILIWCHSSNIFATDVIAWDGEFCGMDWSTMSHEILFDEWEIYEDA